MLLALSGYSVTPPTRCIPAPQASRTCMLSFPNHQPFFDLDQRSLLFRVPSSTCWGPGRRGYDHANQQPQKRQPPRQLVGRTEFDDGSGSDPTGHCVAIPLTNSHTYLFVVLWQFGERADSKELHDSVLRVEPPLRSLEAPSNAQPSETMFCDCRNFEERSGSRSISWVQFRFEEQTARLGFEQIMNSSRGAGPQRSLP